MAIEMISGAAGGLSAMMTGAAGGGAAPVSGTASVSSVGSSSNKVYDKKDLNKDGVVSIEEEIMYALLHPEDTDTTSSTRTSNQTYDQLGQITTNSLGNTGGINITA